MLQLLTKLVELMFGWRKDQSGKRQDLLEQLAVFGSEWKASFTELYLNRRRDGDGDRSDATMASFLKLERLDGNGQKLHLAFRRAFPQPTILSALAEMFRRMSLTKVSMAMVERDSIDEAFSADASWVNCSVRRVLGITAEELGIDLADPTSPFLVGYYAVMHLPDEADETSQPPSSKIMYLNELAKVKARWEAAGHIWEEPPMPKF